MADEGDDRHAAVAAGVDATGTPLTTEIVGGLDAAYPDAAVGAAILWEADEAAIAAAGVGLDLDPAPYVPGQLYRRELPALEAALRDLALPRARQVPWLVDGHGLLHPQRAGLACHVGVGLDLQTVGVAKAPLETDPVEGLDPGEAEAIRDGETLLGYAYRPTAEATNPIYVSPGHRIGPEAALDLVRPLCAHRVPEPIRAADAQAASAVEGNR